MTRPGQCFRLPAVWILWLLVPILVAAVQLPAGAAQQYTPEIVDPLTERWRWMHFPELDGKGVRCIAEDQLGQVWFGLEEGIITYNGRLWTTYNTSHGLPSTPIQHILPTSNGFIYAASAAGVHVFKDQQWNVVLPIAESVAFEAFQLRELSAGSVMIGTNFGVIQIQDERITRVFTTAGLLAEAEALFDKVEFILLPEAAVDGDGFHISDILEDSRDNLWFSVSLSTSGTLIQFKQREVGEGVIEKYVIHGSTGERPFGEDQKLIETRQGEIWVVNRSFKVGVNIFDGNTWRTVRLNDLFNADEYCTSIYQTADGTIWITSLGKLYTIHNGIWNIYRSSDTRIPTNKVIIAPSEAQRLWIGGFKSQVYLFDYSSERWLTYKNLNYQCEGQDQSLWFIDVTGAAVVKNGDDWRTFDAKDGLIDAPVRIISSSNGQIWAAGSHRGVAATAVFEDGSWERHLHPTLSWGIDYRAVLEAFDGSLWFGGAVDFDRDRNQTGGVLQLKFGPGGEKRWIHHRYRENGLTQSNAYGIGQSRDSLIWIGGGSLFYYDGVQWRKSEKPLLRDFVNIVHSTPDGLLLVGSRYYGIFLYDGKEWTMFNTESGLLSNTIMSLYSGTSHAIWAATESDISRYDNESWVNNVFPEQMHISFEGGSIYGSSDGVIWINKSLREWNRRAFVGEKDAIDFRKSFLTYSYNPDNHAPQTHIDVHTEKVSPKGNTLITWSGEDYMSTTPEDRLSYSYRLNEGPWSPFSPQQHKTFVNLKHGNYTLEVRARDIDMNVDPTPAVVHFQVQPPVWKQTWFILLMLAFVTVTSLFEFRVINKNKILQRLNNSLSAINAELQGKNEQIAMQNTEILKQQEQILEQKRQLEESFKNLTSQKKEIEFQRDKLAEMVVQIEALNKSKIKFFTNVSHELRTPLTLILGPAHKLQDQMESLPREKQAKFYKIIERNAYKLLKLINQLLEMRRIENNQLELRMSRGDIAEFLGDIAQLFESLATERQIRFGFVNTCTTTTAMFDKDKVEKIVTNLLSNAFKHTPENGTILIRLMDHTKEPAGSSNGTQTADYFRIVVEDTGTGISEDRLPHIFERYYSDDSDRLSSGIGLSYIKELVELHNGHIAIESEKDVGTKCFVDLPSGPGTGEAHDAVEEASGFLMSASEVSHLFSLIEPEPKDVFAQPGDPDRANVLIVENDPDLLDFLAVMLEDNYNVFKAANGLTGLDVARHENIDLVLSDIMMPQMDGLELCHHLKSDLLTSHIPVILLTAKAMDAHRMQGYMQGADAYMTKPFNPRVLESRIENLLAQRAQLRDTFNRDFVLKPKHITLDSVDDMLLQNIVTIMEEHIDESEFNVNKMCHMVGMSHTHFIRKVKQLTGKKPVELLKSFRLNRAKDLLAQNIANISEIAYMVGYNLPNSFSRAFKKEFGMSPKEYASQFDEASSENGMRAADDTPGQESRV